MAHNRERQRKEALDPHKGLDNTTEHALPHARMPSGMSCPREPAGPFSVAATVTRSSATSPWPGASRALHGGVLGVSIFWALAVLWGRGRPCECPQPQKSIEGAAEWRPAGPIKLPTETQDGHSIRGPLEDTGRAGRTPGARHGSERQGQP